MSDDTTDSVFLCQESTLCDTQIKPIYTLTSSGEFDLGEFRTRLYFEQSMSDDTVTRSARQDSGHGPNTASFAGKVIGAIKTSSTHNIVASSRTRWLFIQTVSNFPWSYEARVSQ